MSSDTLPDKLSFVNLFSIFFVTVNSALGDNHAKVPLKISPSEVRHIAKFSGLVPAFAALLTRISGSVNFFLNEHPRRACWQKCRLWPFDALA
jgi:hypothetical protein